MNKTLLTFILVAMNIVFFDMDCLGSGHSTGQQPLSNEKKLEQSLDVFSKKVISKNKVTNLQYKRYGNQAVLSFDIVKPNEMMLMLYLLEYSNGNWRISKEYHYTKTTVPAGDNTCRTSQRMNTPAGATDTSANVC